jgi:Zn ribbon nucleic-acid-binding protein
MENKTCPECRTDTVSAGLAFWPGLDEPVAVAECRDCGWAGVEAELDQRLGLSAAA